jgi:LysR family nitrogen assimilation transcriptional regulator
LTDSTSSLDVAALRDFILVVDSGSLTRAASLAGIAQPTMSQRIAQLEAQVGHRLLERGPRGVEATAAGLELYRGAQQVVRQIDGLAASIGTGSSDIRGSVSIGLPSTVAPMLVPELLSLVRERHPGVRLELFESMSGYIEELLGRGRLDLAVLFRESDHPLPGDVRLYDEELFLAGRPGAGAGESATTAQALVERPLVAPGRYSNLRRLVDRFFADAGLVPDVVADVESLTAMVRVAQAGVADAVLPRSVATSFTGPELVLRPLDPPVRRTVVASVAPELHQPRAAVVAARDAVVEAVVRVAGRDEWPGITL